MLHPSRYLNVRCSNWSQPTSFLMLCCCVVVVVLLCGGWWSWLPSACEGCWRIYEATVSGPLWPSSSSASSLFHKHQHQQQQQQQLLPLSSVVHHQNGGGAASWFSWRKKPIFSCAFFVVVFFNEHTEKSVRWRRSDAMDGARSRRNGDTDQPRLTRRLDRNLEKT